MDSWYGLGKWMPTLCFCHTQSTGKKRRIDNAKKAAKNRLTQRVERFTMNHAFLPGVVVRLILFIACELGCFKEVMDMQIESGGEDMPNAFRGIPTFAAHLIHNVVAAKCPTTGILMFFQLYAALFGFE